MKRKKTFPGNAKAQEAPVRTTNVATRDTKFGSRIQMLVWERHTQDKPAHGEQYEQWCAKIAEEFNIDVPTVRKIIATQFMAFQMEMDARRFTLAQRTAQHMDLTMAEVVASVKQALKATVEKAFVDRETGGPLFDSDGKMVVHSQVDFRTIIEASKQAMLLLGMYAPDQRYVKHEHLHAYMDMTPEQLRAQLRSEVEELKRLDPSLASAADSIVVDTEVVN